MRDKIVSIDSARNRRARSRVPVPASVFTGRAEPPFVLFDAQGGVIPPPEAARTVYISPADLPALEGYLRGHLRALTRDPAVSAGDRAWALHRVLLHEATQALEQLDGGFQARGLISVAKHIAHFALEAPNTFSYLSAIEGATYTAAAHAADTALYATALAAANGTDHPAVLNGIVLASVYADAGKLLLPPELREKQGTLDDEGWRLMREHPQHSAELLQRAGVRSGVALRAILGHHERWAGGGYPSALRDAAIPIEARYLAIADSFTALTVERPFAEQRGAFDALREMSSAAGQFEPRLLRIFVPLLGRAIGAQQGAARADSRPG